MKTLNELGSSSVDTAPRQSRERAFTRLELLVVLIVLAFLASVTAPGQARAKPGSQGLQCLNNLRQLMLANLVYQADNAEALPMVFHGGYIPALNSPGRPWASGWLDWSSYTENTNLNYLLQPRYASLAAYLGRDARAYKCPADMYVGGLQRTLGWTERVRSYSANMYVGKGNGWASGPDWTIGGPNNLYIYRGAAKSSDLTIPGPARTWVYMDEHPDSINDPGLCAPNNAANMPDAPATYHNGAAGIVMADGRCEMHRWRGPTMNKPRSQGGLAGINFNAQNNYSTVVGDPDLLWLSYGSPRWSTRTAAD